MTTLHFNEMNLVNELAALPARLRVAFAAACAERLLPAYARFSTKTGRGDPAKLGAIIDRVWHDIGGDKMKADEVSASIELCMTLIPQESDGLWVPEQAAAEDAGAAVAYALRCRQRDDAQEAMWAARRAYEALDDFVTTQERIDTNQPGGEERVISHALVQDELARQRRDLDELLCASDADIVSVADRLKRRARADAQTVFRLRK